MGRALFNGEHLETGASDVIVEFLGDLCDVSSQATHHTGIHYSAAAGSAFSSSTQTHLPGPP
jgi:hypothetical protein